MGALETVRTPPYTGEPVLVIGNGPVGQTTALLLARWGIPTVLLDQRPRRDLVGSKSICQQRDVLDIWDSVGVGRTIADEGLTWTRARTFYRDEELFCVELPSSAWSSFPPFVNISQCRTEQLLDQQIARTPAVDVRWGHTVVKVREDAGGVLADCEVAGEQGTRTVHAPYAVACAGGHGDAVRRSLGVDLSGRSFDDRFLICDVRADLPGWQRERRFYFDPRWNPGRQVLIHPCPGSTFRIDWQVPPGFDLEEEERTGGLDRRIRQIVGAADYEVVWRTVYRFHSRCVDRMRAGRVLLAGDCAHLYAPFGARGLNSGVADAENAAWKLAFVLHGWAGDALLESYDTERRGAALENLDITTHTMDFLCPQTPQAWERRRGLLDRAVTDPTAYPEIDSGRLAEPFWYVGSALTTPDPTRTPAGRPARGTVPLPGAGVLVPDCPVTDPETGRASRLRVLARRGVTLLVAGHDRAAVESAVSGAVEAPLRVYATHDLDPSGAVAEALGARAGEVWVLRPDAYVAAVLPAGTDGVAGAVRKAVGAAGR
jgi:pentachlorophenol monooxygenase/3-(3-hydroxy-phenyl)propionate hydroxylase